nr:hypothetical protein [Tanacetum cinerariifolium]
MCSQPLLQSLSPSSAKLMIMALEEYGYQSRREIRVPKKWRSSYSGDMVENCMNFLELLAKACKGDETSIGLPTDPYFWSRFALKFNEVLQEFWSPKKCEAFATNLGTHYYKDGSNDRISNNCKCLLEEVFVKNANLFPAFAATQVDLEFIEETPPHELVKSPERSTSSVRNISQSEGSSLSEELEAKVRVCIFEMAASRLLNMKEICFAQNYLTNSSWAATIFMGKEDMNLKRDFIIESMTVPEGLEKNKKKRIGALELRDGGSDYLGKGVSMVVVNVNTIIGPALVGKDPTDQTGIDNFMLGANTILAVSLALCKAGASVLKIPLYEKKDITCWKQACHAGIYDSPYWCFSPKEAMKMGVEVYHKLKSVIKKKYGQDTTNVGDESIAKAGYTDKVVIGIDVAASEFYGEKDKTYDLNFKEEEYYNRVGFPSLTDSDMVSDSCLVASVKKSLVRASMRLSNKLLQCLSISS